jgi:hypothetical protein
MRKTLRVLALVLAAAAVGAWLMTGAHRGWTRTSVAHPVVDEVTGIESVRYEKQFVAGIDFLGIALLAAGMLVGAAFLFPAHRSPAPAPSLPRNLSE